MLLVPTLHGHLGRANHALEGCTLKVKITDAGNAVKAANLAGAIHHLISNGEYGNVEVTVNDYTVHPRPGTYSSSIPPTSSRGKTHAAADTQPPTSDSPTEAEIKAAKIDAKIKEWQEAAAEEWQTTKEDLTEVGREVTSTIGAGLQLVGNWLGKRGKDLAAQAEQPRDKN